MFQVGNNIVVFNEQGKLVIRTDDPVKAQEMRRLPFGERMEVNGQLLLELPWTEESCRLLQNIGFDVAEASPFMYSDIPVIEGKYAPMKHQLLTAAFICLNPRCYCLSDPRTGKTGALILAMDYLRKMRYVPGGFLIITTVTTMQSVWRDGIVGTVPSARVAIVNGKNREAQLEEPTDFYITNYDSIRLSFPAFDRAVKEKRIAGCVIDELTHVGNCHSQRHKAIHKLLNGNNMEYVIGATGTPGQNPKVIYGMCRTINRKLLPVDTETGWLHMTTYQWGNETFQRSLSAGAPELFKKVMQPSIRFAKKDIMDLPPVTVQTRECAVSAEQRKVHRGLLDQAVALLDSGETITAANGGVLFSKMLQVAQGFCIDNKGNPVEIPHDDRVKTIVELLEEHGDKAVIFNCFKKGIAMLEAALVKHGFTVGVIHGGVSAGKRAELIKDFTETDSPQVLIAHPTTTAYGVDLARASLMVFDGPPPLGDFAFAQAMERLSSKKQQAESISVVHIVATPEEKKLFASLDKGMKMGTFISTLFEQMRDENGKI